MRNTGTLPITSWTVTFKVPNGLSYLQWNGYNPPGAPVTVTQNGVLLPGDSVTVQFAIGWSGGTVGTPSPITCTAR
ncbi:cellulose binding domain-containing protein [Microbispora oryzae]|uniref:cellulose binding domain-containing protein n=1 Tax=Microbispora oryzae TaxID=2806554 RepID=UPI0027DCF629|nr:cellulose binding domain-containing protein [Microbispora oryzae]